MKISKLFHWLYCIVMLLPVMVAPIFAIYSHRHTLDSYEVTRDIYQVVDFNQLVMPLTRDSDSNGINCKSNGNGKFYFNGTVTDGAYGTNFGSYDLITGHTYVYCGFTIYQSGDYVTFGYIDYLNNSQRGLFVFSSTNPKYYVINFALGNTYNDFEFIPMLFDLTQMFGAGNEPTLAAFDEMFPNDYYEYTISQKLSIKIGTETLNNTDIGSQFLYDLYNTTDKYFNYDRVFNFGDLYSWLNTTFFNGSAPLGFFIFWHLLIYWLLTSLLWLIFDILMYVPSLVHRWLDKASLS